MVQKKKPPLMLMIPGGGFHKLYDPLVARRNARSQGYQVRTVNYALDDPLKAWQQVRDIARKAKQNGREVYAYGESAGGVFASLLAQRGLVRGAVSNSAPSNLNKMSPEMLAPLKGMQNEKLRRLLSPVYHRSKSPILAQHSPDDTIVSNQADLNWAKRDPRVRYQGLTGFHVYGDDYGQTASTQALAYLKALRLRIARRQQK